MGPVGSRRNHEGPGGTRWDQKERSDTGGDTRGTPGGGGPSGLTAQASLLIWLPSLTVGGWGFFIVSKYISDVLNSIS